MGFFDSLLKSAMRRAVNDVVDNAVDTAFNNATNNTNNQQPVQQNAEPPIQIMRPDISGQPAKEQCFFGDDNPDYSEGSMIRYYMFEKADCLYETDSGAGEIDFCYYCADSEEQAEEGYELDLPYICLELSESSNFLNFAYNVVKNQVVNHPYIYEKIQCDSKSNSSGEKHYIVYRLFPVSDAERTKTNSRDLVVCFKPNCPTETRIKVIKAFELIASTMRVEFAEYH